MNSFVRRNSISVNNYCNPTMTDQYIYYVCYQRQLLYPLTQSVKAFCLHQHMIKIFSSTFCHFVKLRINEIVQVNIFSLRYKPDKSFSRNPNQNEMNSMVIIKFSSSFYHIFHRIKIKLAFFDIAIFMYQFCNYDMPFHK